MANFIATSSKKNKIQTNNIFRKAYFNNLFFNFNKKKKKFELKNGQAVF